MKLTDSKVVGFILKISDLRRELQTPDDHAYCGRDYDA